MDIARRAFLGGLAAAIAAPYVVRSGILMPVKAIVRPTVVKLEEAFFAWESIHNNIPIFIVTNLGSGYVRPEDSPPS